MKKISFFSIFIFISAIPYTLSPRPIFAAPLSLSISPATFEIEAQPLDEIRTQFQVNNGTDKILPLDIRLIPFLPKKDSNKVEFLNLDLSIKDFVAIEDKDMPVKDITLQPQESRNLTLHLFIPKDLELNDYYFSIVFLSNPEQPKMTGIGEGELRAYSAISGGIAANVLLAVKENREEPARVTISEFSTSKFLQSGPAIFSLKIKNEGKHFIKPEGKIILTNLFGQTIMLDLPPQNILAGENRPYPLITASNIFLLGPYSAQIEFSSPIYPINGGTKTSFYALPIKQFLLVILTFILLLKFKKKIKLKLSR